MYRIKQYGCAKKVCKIQNDRSGWETGGIIISNLSIIKGVWIKQAFEADNWYELDIELCILSMNTKQ